MSAEQVVVRMQEEPMSNREIEDSEAADQYMPEAVEKTTEETVPEKALEVIESEETAGERFETISDSTVTEYQEEPTEKQQ